MPVRRNAMRRVRSRIAPLKPHIAHQTLYRTPRHVMQAAGLFRLVVLSPRRLPGSDRQPGLKPAAGRLISRLIGDELIATSGRAMH